MSRPSLPSGRRCETEETGAWVHPIAHDRHVCAGTRCPLQTKPRPITGTWGERAARHLIPILSKADLLGIPKSPAT